MFRGFGCDAESCLLNLVSLVTRVESHTGHGKAETDTFFLQFAHLGLF